MGLPTPPRLAECPRVTATATLSDNPPLPLQGPHTPTCGLCSPPLWPLCPVVIKTLKQLESDPHEGRGVLWSQAVCVQSVASRTRVSSCACHCKCLAHPPSSSVRTWGHPTLSHILKIVMKSSGLTLLKNKRTNKQKHFIAKDLTTESIR